MTETKADESQANEAKDTENAQEEEKKEGELDLETVASTIVTESNADPEEPEEPENKYVLLDRLF